MGLWGREGVMVQLFATAVALAYCVFSWAASDGALARIPSATTTVSVREGDVIKAKGEGRYKLLELIEQLGTTQHSRFGSLLLLPSTGGLPALPALPALPQPHSLNEIVLLQSVRLRSLNHSCVRGDGAFCVDDHIFHGGHGDVWRGNAVGPDGTLDSLSLVLKRMSVRGRPDILLCAQREVYFGRLLRHNHHYTSLLTHFVVNSTSSADDSDDISWWLVFKDEGVSLSRLIYALTATDGVSAIFEPSLLWRRLRLTSRGEDTIRALVYQLISVVANLHSLSIAHRDIKPGNVLLNSDFGETRLVLGDFSSAVDSHSLLHLYGQGEDQGPSVSELTMNYAPPEVSLRGYRGTKRGGSANSGSANSSANSSAHNAPRTISSYKQYDVWSVGVVMLELILGTDDVFRVDQRTAAVIEHKLAETRAAASEEAHADHDALLRDSLLLAGLADFCIYKGPPLATGKHQQQQQQRQQESCRGAGTARSFANALRKRDPLGIGFEAGGSADASSTGRRRRREAAPPTNSGSGGWGTDLLLRLLQFEPADRISMKDALGHAWFTGPWMGRDGRAWATRAERDSSEGDVVEGGRAEVAVVGREGGGALPRGAARGVGIPPVLSLLPLLEEAPEIERDDEEKQEEAEEEEGEEGEEKEEMEEERDEYEEGLSRRLTPPEHHGRPSQSQPGAVDHEEGSEPAKGAFSCPRCGRHFHDWDSCHSHMQLRRHLGPFPQPANATTTYHTTCLYDAARARVPDCMAAHSLLPTDRLSGWCDLLGRRALMEDTHCLLHSPRWGYALYGVFDGHLGSRASKFASKFTGQLFDLSLGQGGEEGEGEGEGQEGGEEGKEVEEEEGKEEREDADAMGLAGAHARLLRLNPLLDPDQLPPLASPSTLVAASAKTEPKAAATPEAAEAEAEAEAVTVAVAVAEAEAAVAAVSAEQAASAMQRAFVATSHYVNEYEHGAGRRESAQGSGTTATVAVIFGPASPASSSASSSSQPQRHLLVASAGDSRAVLCCTPLGRPVVLTEDHTPKVAAERLRVTRRGGRVVNTGHTLRVNGQLAVTRSIGDSHLRGVLTACPDVLVLRLVSAPLPSKTEASTPCAELRARLAAGRETYPAPLFLILGSDGLFDVIGNGEAVDLVCGHLLSRLDDRTGVRAGEDDDAGVSSGGGSASGWLEPSDGLLHDAARMLAQEAYVRGSGDNIGVCVVALDLGF